MKIADIKIGKRYREIMGDIDGLAASIKDVSLLNPITVNDKGELVAGMRRLEAYKKLGLDDVPVTIIKAEKSQQAQLDENVIRKPLEPKATVAAWMDIESHQGEQLRSDSERSQEKPIKQAAKMLGVSTDTLSKAKQVVDSGKQKLIDQMNKTGNVNKAYMELKHQQRQAEYDKAAAEVKPSKAYHIFQADIADGNETMKHIKPESVDWIITDPPYPKEYLPLYDTLAVLALYALKPNGSLIVMVGQSYLPEIIVKLQEKLTYHWALAYLTPGRATKLWSRRVNTFWKPLLWFVRPGFMADWPGTDVFKSDAPDKKNHEWGQSESGMGDIIKKLTKPGQMILDPFLGSGTTGVVAVRAKRRFIGFDISADCVATAKGRLAKTEEASK